MKIEHIDEWRMIEHEYIVNDGNAVSHFLADRSYLIPILIELPARIRQYFDSAQLSLEVFVDPEVADYVKLLALINTELDPEQALDTMEKFDKQWWLKNKPRTQGELIIDVEFV